ncbi:MAG: CehA/McbA family metallohydrolase [Turicibacter sp.]
MKKFNCFSVVLSILIIYGVGILIIDNKEKNEMLTSGQLNTVTGVVKDEDLESIIAQIKVFDPEGNLLSRGQTNLEGAFELTLGKGEYIIEVSKGYEYQSVSAKIDIIDNLPIALGTVKLTKTLDWSAYGYYGGDLHQHSIYSDGHQPVSDIFLSNLATGLRFGILSDHNSTDGLEEWKLTSTYKLGISQQFVPIGAVEVTTKIGHFQAFDTQHVFEIEPVTDETGLNNLIDEMRGATGLLQINHPGRSDQLGFHLWDSVSKFDCIEIWNGHSIPPMDGQFDILEEHNYNVKSKEKWFELLNSGIRLTATGGSDNHDITGQSQVRIEGENEVFNKWYREGLFTGNPTTYVKLDSLTEDNILTSLSKGSSFLSNGPLMDITINGKSFGDTIPFNEVAIVNYHIASNKSNLTQLNIIADGIIIESVDLDANDVKEGIELNVSGYQWLVFEVLTNDYGYAISNPIYVK